MLPTLKKTSPLQRRSLPGERAGRFTSTMKSTITSGQSANVRFSADGSRSSAVLRATLSAVNKVLPHSALAACLVPAPSSVTTTTPSPDALDSQWCDFVSRVEGQVSSSVIASANQFWRAARTRGWIPPMPQAVPSPTGYLQFMWKRVDGLVLVDVYDDHLEWFYRSRTGELAGDDFDDASCPPSELAARMRVAVG